MDKLTMSSELKEAVKKMLALKEQDASIELIKGPAGDATTAMLKLKETYRLLCLEAESEREETNKNKLNVDQAHLQLQNLLYEKQYYEKEIRSYTNFTSQFTENDISLMTVEEFESVAPPEFTVNKDDAHKYMIQRLSHEKLTRQELLKSLEKFEAEKAKAQQAVNQKRAALGSLGSNLSALYEATKPLVEVLAPQLHLNLQPAAGRRLPLPLYVLYSQLAGTKEAFGMTYEVAFTADVSQVEQSAGRGVPMSEDQEPSTKRPRPGSEMEQVEPAEPLSVHPSSVQLFLPLESGKKVTVVFSYLPVLRLVCAHAETPQDNQMLGYLFPDDTGRLDTFELAVQLLPDAATAQLPHSAKPYRWCQYLAGVDFISSLPAVVQQPLSPSEEASLADSMSKYRAENRVRTFINQLLRLKQGSLALNETLAMLGRCKLPAVKDAVARPLGFTFVKWQEIAAPKPSAAPQLAQEQQFGYSTAPASVLEARAGPSSGAGGETAMAEAEQQLLIKLPGGAEEDEDEGVLQEEGELEGAMRQSTPTPAPPSPYPTAAEPMDLGVADGEAASGKQEPTTAAAAVVLRNVQSSWRPPYRCFTVVLRTLPVDLEARVAVFLEYPLRAPLLRCVRLRLLEADKAGKLLVKSVLTDHHSNDLLWLEHQVNVVAPASTAPGSEARVLEQQMLRLRACLDELSTRVAAEISRDKQGADLQRKLQARQRLVGRARHCPITAAP